MAFDYKAVPDDQTTGLTLRGRQIILARIRGPKALRRHTKKGWYSDDQKTHAAALYAASGSIGQVAELAGLPKSTIRGWLNEPWWKAIQDEIRIENNSKIEAKMNNILETAVDQIADRIENGNQQLDQKTGRLINIPVSLRDLTQVTATIIEKRQTILGKDGSGEGNITAIQRLENLATQFEKMVGKVKPKEIIDVEFKEIKDVNANRNSEGDTPEERRQRLESDLRNYQRESREVEAVLLPKEGSIGTELLTEGP